MSHVVIVEGIAWDDATISPPTGYTIDQCDLIPHKKKINMHANDGVNFDYIYRVMLMSVLRVGEIGIFFPLVSMNVRAILR
jgi:hypothetical protein